MEIRRFFVNHSHINGKTVTLTGDEFYHMTKVLRYKEGYKAVILANDGIERLATVDSIGKDSATLTIESETVVDKKHAKVTLYCGLLKNNKLDFVVQKGVELGVDVIVPFVSQNSAETKFNLDRARKIALESAKQCGSVYLSQVNDLVDFDESLKNADYVISGEGRIDSQSASGKVLSGIGKRCQKYNVPLLCIAGCTGDGYESVYDIGVKKIYTLVGDGVDTEYAIKNASEVYSQKAKELFSSLK